MPPTQEMVRRFANEIRQKLDKASMPVSNSWLSRFCKRHPEILVKKTKPMEAARIGRKTFSSGSRNMTLSYRNTILLLAISGTLMKLAF